MRFASRLLWLVCLQVMRSKATEHELQLFGPTTIDPLADTMSLTVAGTTLTVDMNDGDGLGNPVTTAQELNEAAARL